MIDKLKKRHPDAVHHEVGFMPPRPGHKMFVSVVFVINLPFALAEGAAWLS